MDDFAKGINGLNRTHADFVLYLLELVLGLFAFPVLGLHVGHLLAVQLLLKVLLRLPVLQLGGLVIL